LFKQKPGFSGLFHFLLQHAATLTLILWMPQTDTNNDAGAKSADTVAWFAVLENARVRHDFERAAYARKQLEQLGVKVSYSQAAALSQKGASRG
jgi:hypothetical protein